MSLVVIGSGTEIGKTITCAVLLARYSGHCHPAYWKPIATGSAEGRDTDVIRELCGDSVEVLQERYLFDPPVSPHLAARHAKKVIRPEGVLESLQTYGRVHRNRALVIEGIGGLLVPLTDEGYLLADLLQEMGLPCLLVASSALGTINHTLLTLEAMRRRQLTLAGVILNGVPNQENRRAIEKFGEAEVVSEIEPLGTPTPERVAEASKRFDPKGVLQRFLES